MCIMKTMSKPGVQVCNHVKVNGGLTLVLTSSASAASSCSKVAPCSSCFGINLQGRNKQQKAVGSTMASPASCQPCLRDSEVCFKSGGAAIATFMSADLGEALRAGPAAHLFRF